MKKKLKWHHRTVLLVLLSVALFYNCSKKKDEVSPSSGNGGITPEQTNVHTYEIVSLKSKQTLASSYNGTFAGVPVLLTKTSDSTLAFIVPEVAGGERVLTFGQSSINFTVTVTTSSDAEQTITDLLETFDANIDAIEPDNAEEAGDVDSMTMAKMAITNYMNSLSTEEKKQAVLFYEANKELFTPFVQLVNTTPGPINLRTAMDDCPETNYKTYYLCHASRLSNMATSLYLSLEKGGSVFGTNSKGLLGGMYLLITKVRPAIFEYREHATAFFSAKWVFSDRIFQSTLYQFTDQEFKDIGLNPFFRTLDSEEDRYLSPETSDLNNAIIGLGASWNEFKFLGAFPAHMTGSRVATLQNGDITVSNISNPRVEYMGHSGKSIRFKSINGTDETFQYTIQVEKEGFVHSKVLSGSLRAFDSLALYRQKVIGTWIHTWPTGAIDEYEMLEGGKGYRSYTTTAEGVKTAIEPFDYYNTVTWRLSGTNNDFAFGFTYDNRNVGYGGLIKYHSLQFTSSYGVTKKQ